MNKQRGRFSRFPLFVEAGAVEAASQRLWDGSSTSWPLIMPGPRAVAVGFACLLAALLASPGDATKASGQAQATQLAAACPADCLCSLPLRTVP